MYPIFFFVASLFTGIGSKSVGSNRLPISSKQSVYLTISCNQGFKPNDTIQVEFIKDNKYYRTGSTQFFLTPDSSGKCFVELKDVSSFSKLSFFNKRLRLGMADLRCLPGGRVNMNIDVQSGVSIIFFKGDQSEKYKCQYSIDSAFKNVLREYVVRYNNKGNETSPDLAGMKFAWNKNIEIANRKTGSIREI